MDAGRIAGWRSRVDAGCKHSGGAGWVQGGAAWWMQGGDGVETEVAVTSEAAEVELDLC